MSGTRPEPSPAGATPAGRDRPRLTRRAAGIGPPPPVRIVHIGVGAFHRAHQAWYTQRAGDGWGIAAVAPRSPAPVDALGPQDGLYTVLARDPAGDRCELVGAIAAVHRGTDPAWVASLADPGVAVVTVTVTEAGYVAGSPILGRLLDGLDARRRAGAGGLAVVSCDNLAGNGTVLADLLGAAARRRDVALARYLAEDCTFPLTVVDRITPAAGPADLADVAAATGFDDRAAVVTEPATEWVLEDRFPAGRPAWQRAGARFVDDVAPFAARKLLLLNAGHTLLACLGGLRGHRFVHEAAADAVVGDELHALWDDAEVLLAAGGSAGYRADVEARWANVRLPHALAQIAADGSLKLRQRIVPTLLAAREGGAGSPTAVRVLGAWVLQWRGLSPVRATDPAGAQLAAVARLPWTEAVEVALGAVDARLLAPGLVAEVTAAARDLAAQGGGAARR